MGEAFDTSFDDLPQEIPVFPLPRVILLPRIQLPLNIFEPRYMAMTRSAMANGRLIGMIQPRPDGDGEKIFKTGCAGRIASFSETDDGRYLITLKGVCRFDVAEELPMNIFEAIMNSFAMLAKRGRFLNGPGTTSMSEK